GRPHPSMGASVTTRAARLPVWLLMVALVGVPLIEIYVLIRVGHLIGVWPTIVLLVADSIVGSWLIAREGRRAWRALRTALDRGQLPAKELADGALILVGGTLMLTPGFVTDTVGLVLIFPLTRPMVRASITRYLSRRGTVDPRRPQPHRRPGSGMGTVITGEVIDD
ncbi:MAG: FxsA family protein, partial [Nocardioides sp.]